MPNDAVKAADEKRQLKGANNKTHIILVLILGFSGSFLFSRPMDDIGANPWSARALADAERLGRSFTLLLDHSNSPLQSLATLFNGSGRVAADEFANTIDYLKGHRKALFPDSMGFLTKSQPSSCGQDNGCWMVAYSTDSTGVLRPGSDVSRFGPMAETIDAALASENALVIGPAFQRDKGNLYSYYAVTIRNTRQFGVVVSLIDYESLIDLMTAESVPEGMRLRLQASFLEGAVMSKPYFIVGGPEPSHDTIKTIKISAEIDGAKYIMLWDVLPSYDGGGDKRTSEHAMYTGIFVTLLIALMLWGRLRT